MSYEVFHRDVSVLVEFYVRVLGFTVTGDDVDAEYGRVLDSGWPVADPPQDRPWGMTDFRLFDPTGQYLRITGLRASS